MTAEYFPVKSCGYKKFLRLFRDDQRFTPVVQMCHTCGPIWRENGQNSVRWQDSTILLHFLLKWMAINTVWHKSFVQGFNSCSWFAEISLSRKKKEHYRQFNDELQGRMRGAWVASFLYFVFDGVSRFRQQGSCWYWTPSFRRVSNCISFVSIARNVVTCEHVIKRNVIFIGFFVLITLGFIFTTLNRWALRWF